MPTPTSFVIKPGHKLDINNNPETTWIKVVADPHPLVLECVSDDKASLRVHIIGNEWTNVVVESKVRLYRVFNPSCNGTECVLHIRPSHGEDNLGGTEKKHSNMTIAPREERSISSLERLMPRVPQPPKVPRPVEDVHINIHVILDGRPKLFASFDKITIKYYHRGQEFLQCIVSVGQDFLLTVHEAPNTALSRGIGEVTFYNPWPFDAKELTFSSFGVFARK